MTKEEKDKLAEERAAKLSRYYKATDLKVPPVYHWGPCMARRLKNCLRKAKAGDWKAGNRLANRVGSLRRSMGSYEAFKDLPDYLTLAIDNSINFLIEDGRKVDLTHNRPGMWITKRNGRSARF